MSRKKHSRPLEQPPTEIIRGAQIMAEYLPQEVSDFCDNPLTESLTPTLTVEEVTEYLFQLPPYADEDREMSQAARLHKTETAREFFVPNGKHLTVYYAITNMIRRGYVRRNPVLWEYWKQVHSNVESFLRAIKEKPFPNSRARGLSIVGTGGTGKSTTVEKVLQSLPQVITHVSYKGRDFIMKQLVWLKLDCPRKGSLRELCVTFFDAVDEILGTQYKKCYAGSSHRTLESLIAGIARVAANHCLGIIVIDEIQDLSEARSGGDITMVNFFVHLENAIGVPFALIGTQDANPLLCSQFRQLRRVSEQGYIIWDRMSEVEPELEEYEDDDDEDDDGTARADISPVPTVSQEEGGDQQKIPQPDPVWKNFVETLWVYQYVKHPRTLKDNVVVDKCAHTLYKVAKGIPAVVQTVFVLTQQMAILKKEEKITPRLIRETVWHYQQLIEEMLGEARMKKPREIKPVGDLADMDEIYEAGDFDDTSQTETGGSETMNDMTSVNVGVDIDAQPTPKGASSKPAIARGLPPSGSQTKKVDKKLGLTREKLTKDDLRNQPTRGGAQTQSGGSRKQDKYSRPPDEYLKVK